jgi:hypothetical protein
MDLPEQEPCFAALKNENGHVWQLDSNDFMVNYFVIITCQLVKHLLND